MSTLLFAVVKIFKVFFLSVGFLWLLIAIAVWLLAICRDHALTWARRLLIATLLLFWLLSSEPMARLLTASIEQRYQPISEVKNQAQAIVILAGGSNDRENLPAALSLGDSSLRRSLEGLRLWRLQQRISGKTLPIIVSGGASPFKEEVPVALVMRQFLIDQGVAAKWILTESQSGNTHDNVLYSEQILLQEGIDPRQNYVYLVTSAIHLWRAELIAKKANWRFIAAPSDYRSEQGSFDFRSFLPSSQYLYDSDAAIHEYIGIAFYRFKGYL